MSGGPFAPLFPLFGQIQDFYIFQRHGEWMAVVFEEARSRRYFLVYFWEESRWRRRMEFGSREDEGQFGEIVGRHAPISSIYYPLPSWGDTIAVVEGTVQIWIVIYKYDNNWRPMTEFLLPQPR